jgi:hypothetical protein
LREVGENYIMRSFIICSPPNIITIIMSRRMRLKGHVARMGAEKDAHRVLVGKPEEETPLGRPGCRRESIIKNDLRETGWSVTDWIDLAQNRNQQRALVNTVMNYFQCLYPVA